MIPKSKIVVTGGSGRFAQSLRKIKSKYKFIYPNKKSLDITNINSIKRVLKKKNQNLFYILLVCQGLWLYMTKI